MRRKATLVPVLLRSPALGLGASAAALLAFLTALGSPEALGASAGRGNSLNREMTVSSRWLATRLGTTGMVVVHVGGDDTIYRQGHVPGARFLPASSLAVERGGIPNEFPSLVRLTETIRSLGIRSNSRIVLYDDGAGLLAARAWIAFEILGLADRTSILDGQLARWKAEDKPLSTRVPTVTPSDFVPDPQPFRVVALEAMRDLVWAAGEGAPVKLIDARPRDQYTGATPGGGVTRPGHIPGAVSVFWRGNVEEEGPPLLRGLHRLQDLYRPADLRPEDLVVVYCRTGMQASHSYFTLRYLGFDVRLYDGSYLEWSAAPGTPIVSGDEAREGRTR